MNVGTLESVGDHDIALVFNKGWPQVGMKIGDILEVEIEMIKV